MNECVTVSAVVAYLALSKLPPQKHSKIRGVEAGVNKYSFSNRPELGMVVIS